MTEMPLPSCLTHFSPQAQKTVVFDKLGGLCLGEKSQLDYKKLQMNCLFYHSIYLFSVIVLSSNGEMKKSYITVTL